METLLDVVLRDETPVQLVNDDGRARHVHDLDGCRDALLVVVALVVVGS